LERCADAAGVELELVTPQDGKVPLAVDADAVDRVLCNLVDNAGKYARNGGPPSVRIEAVATASGLRFSVRDRGPGVPPERARAVFEPFDRGGRDASDPVPGIGLGLALARDLARDMGGDLTLRHPEGGGACFLLELPTRARTRR
jgi:signal transduction histidine kinase